MEKRIKEHYFFADTHVDRKKVRAAVSLEQLIQELPNEESYAAAKFSNHILQQTCIYLKDMRHLNVTKDMVAKLVKDKIYKKIDEKRLANPKINSFLKNIVHAKFASDIYNK